MAINGVRDYRPWSHDDEICFMLPCEVHEAYSPMPGPFSAELESALNRIAQQDVGLTGGPRGKLPIHSGRTLNR